MSAPPKRWCEPLTRAMLDKAPRDAMTVKATVEALIEEIHHLHEHAKWLAQTVHQAHHEGPTDTCASDICASTRKMLP